MKPLKCILLMMLFAGMGATAMAQQRLINNNMNDYRQRLSSLQLTAEQRIRLANLIRRERMQFYMNQKELNEILTDKQRAMLLNWRNKQAGSDSTAVRKN
jgi:hypothetical protein